MYRTTAEREAGFVESVVVPRLKQRNPVREQAVETVKTLLKLGDSMSVDAAPGAPRLHRFLSSCGPGHPRPRGVARRRRARR